MGSRTKARECALQALYQLDTSGGDARDAVRGVLAHFEDADKETERFADELVRGVQSERPAIDAQRPIRFVEDAPGKGPAPAAKPIRDAHP